MVIPLGPDLYSVQGLKNLGPTLRRWREEWRDRLNRAPESFGKTTELPEGRMDPVGYVVLQHAVRRDRPVKAYQRWLDRVPSVYSKWVLGETAQQPPSSPKEDPHCLAELKYYRSLMPLTQTARKPMFRPPPRMGPRRSLQGSPGLPKGFSALAETLLERCDIRQP